VYGTELLARAVTAGLMREGVLPHLLLTDSGMTVPEGGATVVDTDHGGKKLRVMLSWVAQTLTVNNRPVQKRTQRLTLSSDDIAVDGMNQWVQECAARYKESLVKRYPVGRRFFRANLFTRGYGAEENQLLVYTDAGEVPMAPIDWDTVYLEPTDKEVLQKGWERVCNHNGKCSFLLWGKPGTGKTHTVNKLIAAADRHVILLPPNFASWSTGILQQMFESSKMTVSNANGGHANATYDIPPLSCIFVVEEMEGVVWSHPSAGGKRKRGDEKTPNTSAADNTSRSSLLTLLDGIPNYRTLVILATTNHDPSSFDPALMRPGRLRPVQFPLVSRESAEAMGLPQSIAKNISNGDEKSMATLFELSTSA
jgi:hypothetical protein